MFNKSICSNNYKLNFLKYFILCKIKMHSKPPNNEHFINLFKWSSDKSLYIKPHYKFFWRLSSPVTLIESVSFVSAIMARILSRIDENEDDEHTKGWAKFMISVEAVYKKSRESRIRKNTMTLIVPLADLTCKCPKLKANKWVMT